MCAQTPLQSILRPRRQPMLVQEITNFLCFKVYYDRPVYPATFPQNVFQNFRFLNLGGFCPVQGKEDGHR